MYKDKIMYLYVKGKQVLRECRGEFGVGSILSIAVALIVSAFVLVPGMKDFAGKIIVDMTAWWDETITNQIFPTSIKTKKIAMTVVNYCRGLNG